MAQNGLYHVWMRQRAQQTGHGEIYEESLMKLTYGVPIMLEDDDFRAMWQPLRLIPFNQMLESMPLIPVTRLMDTEQMHRYLLMIEEDSIQNNLELSQPWQYAEAMQ